MKEEIKEILFDILGVLIFALLIYSMCFLPSGN